MQETAYAAAQGLAQKPVQERVEQGGGVRQSPAKVLDWEPWSQVKQAQQDADLKQKYRGDRRSFQHEY